VLAHRFRQRGACHDLERPQRRTPRAKVLRGELVAHRVPQVLVHLARVDRAQRALIQILEQALSRQLMASAHDAREPLVVDDDLVLHAALGAELEQEPS